MLGHVEYVFLSFLETGGNHVFLSTLSSHSVFRSLFLSHAWRQI